LIGIREKRLEPAKNPLVGLPCPFRTPVVFEVLEE